MPNRNGTAAIGKAVDGTVLLSMQDVSKFFGSIQVLDTISFDVRAGEVHALCGENGAGKSTLMKILTGAFPVSSGRILLNGQEMRFVHPVEARAAGIGIIHQELSLLPHRTVAENILLGREPSRGGLVDRRRMVTEARDALARLGSAIPPEAPVASLSIAEQQVVEIAKAIATHARLLVFDEPTAPLDTVESAKLFRVIAELRSSGVGIVYISHRMREVFEIADRITVLKDGCGMGTFDAADATPDKVIRLMVGRPVSALFPPRSATTPGEALLTILGGGNAALHDIDLTLYAGQILGVAGLEGSGKTALARALVGDQRFTTGQITFRDGRPAPRSPREAVQRGIAYLSDDRKAEGLGLRQSLRDNASLALRALAAGLALPSIANRNPGRIDALFRDVEMRAADFGVAVGRLSGGNQQKVVFARWLATAPHLWVVAEPTRGIDVGAKATIYALLRRYADAGGAVVMVSSDLTEIIGASDRILVMSGGRILVELPAGSAESEIMAHAVHGPGQVAELVA
ncbi:sugar ABC transporter ATP-binding protein [Acidisoma cellulosilytica]|uniref:Sugar ABC transporter ATP-binding protein n=1 Tax=Acidisoma cellulosilyticum TaxID=2802395 RepID=A0A963Z2L7_9PROT|nr:sugar ABC transporter ATP-binding protein [Acidisoma cellulosilyticum]MCB8881366.1 sugar ABC transporter ATP-binding protein [Acidisoma cellulosilyticum]